LWAPFLNGQIDLGIQQFAQEEMETALNTFRQVQDNAKEVESPRAVARAGYWIGNTLQSLNRLKEAEPVLESTRTFWSRNGFRREQLRTELVLAGVWRKQGRDADATKLTDEILSKVKDFGDHNLIDLAYRRQATYMMNRGQYPRALELGRALSAEAESAGFVSDLALAEQFNARALLNLGRWQELEKTLAAMRTRFKSANDQLEWKAIHATALLERGQPGEALALYKEIERDAAERKLERWKRRIPTLLCIAATQLDASAARKECQPLLDPVENRETAAARDFILADFFLVSQDYAQSRERASRAYEFYRNAGNEDNALYSLLIRGQAEKRSGLAAELAETRKLTSDGFRRIQQDWGAAEGERFLQRILYKKRWDEIHRNSN
jgi:tetratricopeptide (TPR) repeat protein